MCRFAQDYGLFCVTFYKLYPSSDIYVNIFSKGFPTFHKVNCTTFPEYMLVHNIWQFKLFVVQTLLEIAELQKYWGAGGWRYFKKSLELIDESWIIISCAREVILIRQV